MSTENPDKELLPVPAIGELKFEDGVLLVYQWSVLESKLDWYRVPGQEDV